MKKQYIQPEIKTHKLGSVNLLVGTTPKIDVDDSITGEQYPPEEGGGGGSTTPPPIDLGGGGDGTNFGF